MRRFFLMNPLTTLDVGARYEERSGMRFPDLEMTAQLWIQKLDKPSQGCLDEDKRETPRGGPQDT